MKRDYYAILGVGEDAAEEEIKRQYRALVKKYHPDANPGNEEAGKRFREVGEAYGTLGDQEKRRAYDRERRAGQRAGGSRVGKENRPGSSKTEEGKQDRKQKTKTNPLDMTEMFERYMGIRRK